MVPASLLRLLAALTSQPLPFELPLCSPEASERWMDLDLPVASGVLLRLVSCFFSGFRLWWEGPWTLR